MTSTTEQLELLAKIVVGIIIFCSFALICPLSNIVTSLNAFMTDLNREGFLNSGYPTSQLCKMPLISPEPVKYGPADSTVKNPKEPYHLLGDYIKPAQERIANFTSECAYIADGQRLLEKTGSYGQVTNNYKQKKPDNGTTWLRELSVSFYE
jgi:hypothetical protein